MTKLYLDYEETRLSGGEPTSDETWCEYTDSYYNWELKEVFLNKDNADWYRREETVNFNVKSGDTVYVVWVQYSTGDTFSHSEGHGTIVGVYKTYDEAKEVQQKIETNKFGGKYHPWNGYFDSLEQIHIERRDVI
jgi:hypothetical protein